MYNKIYVAGNIIIDRLYPTDGYPARGQLVKIGDGFHTMTGGAVCNVGMDLAALSPDISICGLGCVGQDEDGDFALRQMTEAGMNCSGIRRVERPTAFTLVMADQRSRERTFFTYAGANDLLSADDFCFDEIKADLFHIGYILLLDALDQADDTYGTKMARVLADARRHGIKTSIDVVSENSDRFVRLVPPALKYTDYCIINELETSASTGIVLRGEDGTLLRDNIPIALEKLHTMGVAEWAVIHAPEGGFGMDRTGRYVVQGRLNYPAGYVVGTVGAGDAFCAGVLCAAHRGMEIEEAVSLGVATAGMSLRSNSATETVGTVEDAFALLKQYGSI